MKKYLSLPVFQFTFIIFFLLFLLFPGAGYGQYLELSKPTVGEYSSNKSFQVSLTRDLNEELGSAPTKSQNYVITNIFRKPAVLSVDKAKVSEVSQEIQYFDGLGRPIQTIQTKASPFGRDIVQPFTYDALGREATKYLPYTDGTAAAGSYRSNALADTGGVYTGSAQYLFYHQNWETINYSSVSIPSASTAFEPSPLNRVVEQGAPGRDWQLRSCSKRFDYATNDGTSYTARRFGVSIDANGQRSPIDLGNYGAGQLYVTISKNENWLVSQGQDVNRKLNTTEEYKDQEEHVVLKRTYNNNNGVFETLSTYYVYDDFGNLCYVLPPGANADNAVSGQNNQAILNNLCYQYGYDERNRQVSKQLPGKGVEYLVYNALDQVVATQDGNQRSNNQWMITKYDALGRVIMTGSWSNGNTAISPQSLKALVYAQSINWENKDNTQGYGYTMTNTYPHTLDNVLTVNYYDNYSTPYTSPYNYAVNSQIIPAMPAAASTMTQGLLTMSLTAVLNGINNNISPGNMLGTVYYYDDQGRAIQSYEMHYLGGKSINAGNYDQISHSYDFTNAITQTVRVHHNATNSSSPAVITIANSYVYDHMGRKRQTFEQINEGTNVLLSQNDYNEVGQELNKHLHSVDNGASFLQNISYTYNERGWLSTLGTDGFLLNLSLNYNAPAPGTGRTPQWNGNISQMGYGVNKGIDKGTHEFIYNYDGLNRLTKAQSTDSLLDESLNYDQMGNITSLIRGGTSAANLAYTYTDVNGNYSNQLQKVTNNNAVFRSYGYDSNGNATSDGGTQTINYNLLNLPQSIVQGGITKASYIYSAAGNKLRNTGSDGSWDYVNGIVYQNGVISFIQTEEGRASYNVQNGTYNYEYNLKDHLGNTRVSFDKDPTTGKARVIQEDEYYSFGLRKIGGYDFASNNRYLYNGKEIQTDLANQYDYGARFYDPVIGRWNVPDMIAELTPNLTPFRYCFNNPVNFTDPFGLWERTDNGYSTDRKEDIERFFDMMQIEKHSLKNNPSMSQMSSFIDGEMKTGGLGSLSDGSKLAKGFSISSQKDFFGANHYVTDKKSYSNFWHSVQGDLTPEALDLRTLNKQWGGYLGKLSYPGADNPKKYNGQDDYSYNPSNPIEQGGRNHDLEYKALGINGLDGLFNDKRAIPADWRFVRHNIGIAINPAMSPLQRIQGVILGYGLGGLALPKTIGYYTSKMVDSL
ncbi:DUF6443 domain-containing protein [Pedobacter cryoconitis]|uniref:RHS repeat-associated protein n=1 Tax=Pedobacter cryoconitis TaxID=188932 RepID=A0A7X0MI47_9SPHI|nr:DUF6443 domain-containing protein [Pedobacter cryoconitis]MBB6498155.1 RHS repeat-associated protein [Pedobacter cryoconitis]